MNIADADNNVKNKLAGLLGYLRAAGEDSKWANLARILIIAGVKPAGLREMEYLQPTSVEGIWLHKNPTRQQAWNNCVLSEVINKLPYDAKRRLRDVIRRDLHKIQAGKPPNIFTFRQHAEWMIGWLS